MKDYKKKVPNFKFFRKNFTLKSVYSRAAKIADTMVGQKFIVYNGNSFRSLLPKSEIVGTAVGHYVFTKITGQSIHKRKRKKKEKKKRGKKLFVNGY